MDLSTCEDHYELHFTDLTYTVAGRDGHRREILQKVCGGFRSGRLSVILGPSGTGKTTLLNVLSGFKFRGVQGKVTVNGECYKPDKFRLQSCYITQEFALLHNLTASETLLVAANLKLGSNFHCHSKHKMISDILELLGLQRTTNTFVQKMSGGEKKRLSIGLELLTNPPFMFFDEPTSGLDSTSSLQMMSHLKLLAQNGRAVICSLHQPSSYTFAMVDDVFVLSNGECLYCGPLDGLVPAFEQVGFTCPQYYNRADFALEVASYEADERLILLAKNCRITHNLPPDDKILTSVDVSDHSGENTLMLPSSDNSTNDAVIITHSSQKNQKYVASMHTQFWILLKRSTLCTFRDLHLAQLRFGTHVVVGLLLSAIYYGIGNDASKVASNAACIFFFIIFFFFSNAMPTVHSFPLEASVFIREHLNNWYSISSYFFSKLLSDVPLQVLCPTVFLLISYFLTEQPSEWQRFIMLWAVCMLLTILAQTIGLAAGSACDMQTGVFLLSGTSIPMFLFSGFFIRLDDIPFYLHWLSYVSYFRLAFEAAMIAIYGFNRPPLKCKLPYCSFKSPEKFLKEMNMTEDSRYWYCIFGLVMWILLLQILFFGLLKWRLSKAR